MLVVGPNCRLDILWSFTILPCIVDWDCSKTLTLLETLRILNQPRVECYVSLEFEHLSLLVGCARSKRQYLTVQPNLMLFLWALVFAWTVPALDLWDLGKEVLHSSKNIPAWRNLLRDENQSKHTNTNTMTTKHTNRDDIVLFNVDTLSRPQHFLT